jgi:hypothetical protein
MTYDMSFEQRLARIDLSKVMEHVREDTGLGDADLARAEDLYRKFLTLCAQKPEGGIVPPRLVDAVWHAHITFTRQYMADCDLLFGQYIHHNPSISEAEAEAGFANTVSIYASQFGVNLNAYGTTAEEWMTAAGCSVN